MSELSLPTNNISSGNIEKFDPIMTIKPLKRLRDIIGNPKIKSELGKNKKNGA